MTVNYLVYMSSQHVPLTRTSAPTGCGQEAQALALTNGTVLEAPGRRPPSTASLRDRLRNVAKGVGSRSPRSCCSSAACTWSRPCSAMDGMSAPCGLSGWLMMPSRYGCSVSGLRDRRRPNQRRLSPPGRPRASTTQTSDQYAQFTLPGPVWKNANPNNIDAAADATRRGCVGRRS
jgi:hypothetical protein